MGTSSRRLKTASIAVLLVAFGLRLSAAVWWEDRLAPGSQFAFGDSFSYWILGERIARGETYEYAQSRVFRAPGYPILLAPLFLIQKDPPVLWARLIGATFGTLAVAGVMLLAAQLFGGRTSIVAGAMGAVYPGTIGMSVFVLSEAPFCPFMLAQISAWVAAWTAKSGQSTAGFAALGGAAAGFATLIRPSWFLFTLFAGLVSLAWRGRRYRALAISMVMLGGMSLVMAPWVVRNHHVTGKFIPTTLELGASLYDGWNPHATGASDMEFMDTFRDQVRLSEDTSVPEVALDRALRDAAITWARANPGSVAQLAITKFLRMWSPWPNASEFQSLSFRFVVAISYLPVLITGIVGTFRYAPRGWPYCLCLVPAAYFTLMHMIFVSSIRYREPAMMTIIVLSAAIFASLIWRVPIHAIANSPSLETQE